MGDMGEAFREWNEIKKQQKQERYNKNIEIIKQCEFEYRVDQNGVVSFETFKGTVYFYPAINILVFKNMDFRAGGKDVLAFIKNITKSLKL